MIESTNSHILRIDSSGEVQYVSDSLLNALQITSTIPQELLSRITTTLRITSEDELITIDTHADDYISRQLIFPDNSEFSLGRKTTRNRENEIEYVDFLFTPKSIVQHPADSTSTVIGVATGIAHDFNNHLTAVLGQMDIGLSQLDQNSPASSALPANERVHE